MKKGCKGLVTNAEYSDSQALTGEIQIPEYCFPGVPWVCLTHDLKISSANCFFCILVGRFPQDLIGESILSLLPISQQVSLQDLLLSISPVNTLALFSLTGMVKEFRLPVINWIIKGNYVKNRLADFHVYCFTEETLFQRLKDKIPICFCMLYEDKFVHSNQTMQEFLGYSQEELMNMNWWELVASEKWEGIREWIRARHQGKTVPECYELKVLTKYGETRWADFFFNMLDLGEKHIMLAGAIDITKHRLSHKKLLRSELQYRQLAEKVSVAIYTLREGKFEYCNPAMLKVIGYSQEELMNMKWWKLVAPEARDEIKEWSRARQRGDLVPDRCELKVLTKDGEERWVDLIHNDVASEKQKYIIVGANDITARKYAEQELHKIQEELERRVEKRTDALQKVNEELVSLNSTLNNIFMNMSDGVMVINDQGHIEMMNHVLQNSWGDILNEFKEQLKDIILRGNNSYIVQMFRDKTPFRDVEMILPISRGNIHILASGTPINQDQDMNTGLIIVRPIKEVRNLVNRFSGAHARFEFSDIVSNSSLMFEAVAAANSAASNMLNVLIQGESGTGKELFAQAIHNSSDRRNEPFVAVNCGALPRELIGSELFGYAEGAFTGAKKGGNLGKFELASRGTLFLDEIGDTPLEQQVALLRVLEEKQLTRIGGNKVVPVDVRIICATNKDIYQEMQKGHFRKDLYYRLNVINIHVPALRHRPEDIGLLFNHFLLKTTEILKTSPLSVEPDVLIYLENYDWPGNVRELQNVVERLVYSVHEARIGVEHLPLEIRLYTPSSKNELTDRLLGYQNRKNVKTVRELTAKMEEDEIVELLGHFDGNVSKVARHLGISRNTLYTKLKKYNIQVIR